MDHEIQQQQELTRIIFSVCDAATVAAQDAVEQHTTDEGVDTLTQLLPAKSLGALTAERQRHQVMRRPVQLYQLSAYLVADPLCRRAQYEHLRPVGLRGVADGLLGYVDVDGAHGLCDGSGNSGSDTPRVAVYLWCGALVRLELDAIAHETSPTLLGGTGASSRAVFEHAGPLLLRECAAVGQAEPPCEVGDVRITLGYQLPARYVLHTHIPTISTSLKPQTKALSSVYTTSLRLASRYGLSSIAFPVLGTGMHGTPVGLAAQVALRTCISECKLALGTEDAWPIQTVGMQGQSSAARLNALLAGDTEGSPAIETLDRIGTTFSVRHIVLAVSTEIDVEHVRTAWEDLSMDI